MCLCKEQILAEDAALSVCQDDKAAEGGSRMSCPSDFPKDSRFCSGGDGIRKLRRDEMGWMVVVVVHTINLSVYEGETGGSQSLRPP